MPKHRVESRHLPLGVAGLAVVLALWCTGDGTGPAASAPPTDTTAASLHVSATGAAGASAIPAPPPSSSTNTPRPTGVPPSDDEPVSEPARLVVDRIGLNNDLMQLGRRPDRTLEVPPEGPGSPAGWYRDSPAPGQPGPAMLLGHVNATGGGPEVFADLHALVPGDGIRVDREDGSHAMFVVEAVERYAKDTFPTLRVYGNTAGPELRLITCDGYDPHSGAFNDNLVVYAKLVAP
ncbi:class F sortase [Kocuria sp. cx-455]|uniref:class F sortase n=1 Tax=Kocuria sp. cx-455 TaxID=2771377 RepID=UPI003D713256